MNTMLQNLVRRLCLFMGCVLLCSQTTQAIDTARTHSGYYTQQRIANLRANCDKFDWAKRIRTNAINRAEAWVVKSDDELWSMVPGQDLPRCIDVTFDRVTTTGPKFLGCLKCGNKISKYGNYPYNPDFVNAPWKLTCPSCGAVFPTNDFGKYYKSGIDEKGLFNPVKADKKLLFNTAHPDPADPLHKYGVDDGSGYIREDGRAFRFIGYYTWKYWRNITYGITVLSDAYLYTGEQRYAHKAAVLLDRLADVYPSMDWAPYAKRGWYHSDKGTGEGKIEGSIWETGLARRLASDYDKIISGTVNDKVLFSFLKKQSQRYQLPSPKGTRDMFVANLDNNILRCIFKAVKNGQIFGNEGMHQLALAAAAVSLNNNPETTEMLDWIFADNGGAIAQTIINLFDHDGSTNEGAPNYSVFLGEEMTEIADLLQGYPGYTKYSIFKVFPQLAATYTLAYRWAALGQAIPNIGDSGSTGLVSDGYVRPNYIAHGFRYTHDQDIAIAAYRANRNSAAGLDRDIFAKDPDSLSKVIKQIAEKAGPRPLKGYLMSGFGLALLEGKNGDKGIALASNYGRTIKHAHPDMLNFDLFAFGQWLAPDFGYPEFATAWPNRQEWTSSTLSHNTVYVDKKPQKTAWSGHTQLFKQLDGFGVFSIDGQKAYPQLKNYRRTMLMVNGDKADGSGSYIIDIFKVSGGKDHVYSFHGPPGKITATGVNLKAQTTGTYAGKDIEKGALAKQGFPIGYSYLYNVQRDATPPAKFTLDWKAEAGYHGLKAEDGVHLRMHVLNQADDIALADGDPPQNKPGNPERLGFVLLHRAGDNLESTFVSVFEPYTHQPFIKSVNRVDDGKGDKIALQVTRVDGTIDHIVYNMSTQKVTSLSNGISINGSVGFISEVNGKVKRSFLVDGEKLDYGKLHLKSTGAATGRVVKMNRGVSGGGWILVDAQLPTDGSLNGEQIMLETATERDATYTIKSITREGKLSKVYCGPICFVRGQKDGKYLYDFEEGAAFKIALHASLKP